MNIHKNLTEPSQIAILSRCQREMLAHILDPTVATSQMRYQKTLGLLNSSLNAFSRDDFSLANRLSLEGLEEIGTICLHFANYDLGKNTPGLHKRRLKAVSAVYSIVQLIKGEVNYENVERNFENRINFLQNPIKSDDLESIKEDFSWFKSRDKSILNKESLLYTLAHIHSYSANSIFLLYQHFKYDSYEDYEVLNLTTKKVYRILSIQYIQLLLYIIEILHCIVWDLDGELFDIFKNLVTASQSTKEWKELLS